jgi:Fe2+ transport system protein B
MIEIPCREIIEAKKEIESLCHKIKSISLHQKEALILARSEMERRLDGMNEFREQMEKQANSFALRKEEELKHSIIEERIRNIERRIDTQAGSTKWIDHIITGLIGFGIVVAIWLMKGN